MSAHLLFKTSLIKFCQDSIDGMRKQGIIQDAKYVNFDAHSQFTDLPEINLVGTANLHWVNNQFYTVGASIGVSSWADTNLFVHDAMIDYLAELLKPTKQVALIDPDTGIRTGGWLVVEGGVSLMPMLKTDTRSLQFFLVSFQTSETA